MQNLIQERPNTNKILEFINKQRQTNKDKYDLDDLKFIARKCCISIYYEVVSPQTTKPKITRQTLQKTAAPNSNSTACAEKEVRH